MIIPKDLENSIVFYKCTLLSPLCLRNKLLLLYSFMPYGRSCQVVRRPDRWSQSLAGLLTCRLWVAYQTSRCFCGRTRVSELRWQVGSGVRWASVRQRDTIFSRSISVLSHSRLASVIDQCVIRRKATAWVINLHVIYIIMVVYIDWWTTLKWYTI